MSGGLIVLNYLLALFTDLVYIVVEMQFAAPDLITNDNTTLYIQVIFFKEIKHSILCCTILI